MIELNINKKLYNIPNSWDEVTYKQYLNIITIKNDNIVEYYVKIINELGGVDKAIIYQLSQDDFQTLVDQLSFLNNLDLKKYKKKSKIKIKGETYYFKKLSELTLGENINFETLIKNSKNIVNDYHKIMALLLSKKDEVININALEDRAEFFANNLKATDVFTMSAFFLGGGQGLLTHIDPYFSKKLKMKLIMEKKANLLVKKWMSGGRGTRWFILYLVAPLFTLMKYLKRIISRVLTFCRSNMRKTKLKKIKIIK